MPVTAAEIVNRAIQFVGGFNNNKPVTGSPPTFDGTPLGLAAGTLYNSAIQTVARQNGWDFSRNVATLALSGNAAPQGYALEYIYPTNGIQVRQLVPATFPDTYDPLPISWTVGNALVAAVPTKVIWTDLASAKASFTNQPPPDLWDALFTEAVVRLLASELATAIPGKPDSAAQVLGQAATFEGLGAQRGDA